MCIPDLYCAMHSFWKARERAPWMWASKHFRQKTCNKGPKELTYLTKTQEQIWDLDPLEIQRPHTLNPGHLILWIKTLEQKLKTLAVLFPNKGPQITRSESLEHRSSKKHRDLTQWMKTPSPKHVKPQHLEMDFHRFQNLSPRAKALDSQTWTLNSNIQNCKLTVTIISNLTVQNVNTSETLYCAHRSPNASEFILNPRTTDHREAKDLTAWSQTSNSPRIKLQHRDSQMIKYFTAWLWEPTWFQWDLWDTICVKFHWPDTLKTDSPK